MRFGGTSLRHTPGKPRRESCLGDLLIPREMEAYSPRSRLTSLPFLFVTVLPAGVPLPKTRACWSRVSSWPWDFVY